MAMRRTGCGLSARLAAKLSEQRDRRLAAVAARGRSDLTDIKPDAAVLEHWPVRDQNDKPTCVAFAAAAALEYVKARRGEAPEWLSPHFLYHSMREKYGDIEDPPDDYDEGSTALEQAKRVMEEMGVCLEPDAPYARSRIGETVGGKLLLSGIDPPASAVAKAAAQTTTKLDVEIEHERFPDGPPVGNGFVRRFHQALSDGCAVTIGFPLFGTTESATNLDTAEARHRGIVRGPEDPENGIAEGTQPISGHAVCLVGFHRDAADGLGGGWFIFRNSLGLSFGQSAYDGYLGVPRPGYGAISASYLASYCHEYMIFSGSREKDAG